MKNMHLKNSSERLAFDPTSDFFNTTYKEKEQDKKNQFDLIIYSYFKKKQIDMHKN